MHQRRRRTRSEGHHWNIVELVPKRTQLAIFLSEIGTPLGDAMGLCVFKPSKELVRGPRDEPRQLPAYLILPVDGPLVSVFLSPQSIASLV
jgi:hypothetical protein